LISPVVNLRHGEIIQEAEHFLVANRSEDSSLMLLDFTFHSGLEVTGPGRTGEIDSLEGLVVVEGSGIHEDD
jgi:hypothetical protein